MNIAPFRLPSDDNVVVFFKKPKVSDAIEIAKVTPEIEESSTTIYLNQLQDKEKGFSDSLYWTIQDRRTALWWIYIESNIDTGLTALYDCKRCSDALNSERKKAFERGEISHYEEKVITHAVDYDARDFIEGLSYLTVEPYQLTNHTFNGVSKKIKLFPLDGRAAEGLEIFRNTINDLPDVELTGNETPEEKAEIKKLNEAKSELINKMCISRLCYQFSVEGEPDDFSQALEYRYNLLDQMSAGDEFETFVAKIDLMNRDLTHGLDISIRHGVSRIKVPKLHVCPKYYELSEAQKAKESKESYTTRLWVEFRNRMLFPNIRPQRLADINN